MTQIIKYLQRPGICLAFIVIMGLGLRLINLWAQPFWADEVLSLDISTHFQNAHDMIRYVASVEVHPPLYYLLLRFWTDWFGIGTLAVKSLSALFGVGCIVGTFYLGRSLFKDDKIAIFASLVTALLPFQLEFSQEARPYIIYCFFGIVATIAFWQYYQTHRRIFLLPYIVANIIGLYLHYSYFFILIPLAGWGLIEIYLNKEKSREFLAWLSTHAVIAMGFSFWLVPFLFKVLLGSLIIFGWERSYFPIRDPEFFGSLVSQLIWLTKHETLPQIQLLVTLLAQVLLAVGFLWSASILKVKNKSGQLLPVMFLLWLGSMGVILFFISPQSVSYKLVFESHIIFLSIVFGLLVAWTIGQLPKKAAAAALIVFLLSLVPYNTDVLGNDALWDQEYNLEAAGEFISQNYKPGDIVIVSVGFIRTDLSHYLDLQIPVYSVLPINYFGIDAYNTRHTLGFVENEFQSRFTIPSEGEIVTKLNTIDKLYHANRVWLYGFAQKDFTVHHWFSNRNWRQSYRNLGDIFRVDLYSRP